MPRKVQTIVDSGDHIFDRSENQFLRSVKGAEVLIFDELIKILNNLDVTGGKIHSSAKAEQFLMSMDQKIYGALKKADYNNSVLRYTQNFDEIAQNTKELQSALNGINITDAQINPFLKIEVGNTIDKLTGSGMAKDFINPIRQSLYRNIMLGADISTVETTLRDYLITTDDADSKLLRYVKQTSRDAMQQFDGIIQSNIASELGLNALRYIGSLIADSRKQCVRWIEKEGAILMIEDLEEEIAWAFNYGSGMNPDTTVLTFAIYRGGYNCRHRAIPTNVFDK